MRAARLFLLLIPVGLLGALRTGQPVKEGYVGLDQEAQPLKGAFNADVGKGRLLMYVSPTCGGCLRGAKQTQERVLAPNANPNLRIYVVWAPKNGGREQDVGRVTRLVTDSRAAQYWDAHRVVTAGYDSMLALTGPCAGIFALYGPTARWNGSAPPRPDYLEDAHAREFRRPHPQFDADRIAAKARQVLESTRSLP
jgi:hypothetical protein